jgi:hypothetical protein
MVCSPSTYEDAMHLLFLLMTMAGAADPSLCSQDLSDYPLPMMGGPLSKPANFREGALRPGLLRLQDDLCRCVPRRSSKWPDIVIADLWVQPNKGTIRIEYTVKEQQSRQIDRMLECMGEPKVSVEPMPFQTDIIYTDGRAPVFPRYPVRVELADDRVRQRRSQRKK